MSPMGHTIWQKLRRSGGRLHTSWVVSSYVHLLPRLHRHGGYLADILSSCVKEHPMDTHFDRLCHAPASTALSGPTGPGMPVLFTSRVTGLRPAPHGIRHERRGLGMRHPRRPSRCETPAP